MGAEVFGVSVDDASVACEFAADKGVRLLQDAERTIARLFGVVGLLDRVRRVTFVIDGAGVVRDVIRHELQFARHADDALAAVRRLPSL